MALNFGNTASESMQHGIKGVVYGESGVGKTALAATCEAPFIINSDKGLLTLRQFNIPTATINNDKDLSDIKTWIANSQEARQFRTFFFDGISSITDVMLFDALRTGRKDNRLAYADAGRDMTELLIWARDFAGPHIMFTAEVDYVRDKLGGVMRIQPRVPGKGLAPTIAYKFDFIAYMSAQLNPVTQQVDRLLQLQPDDQKVAKARVGFNTSIGPYERAHLGNLFNKIASA